MLRIAWLAGDETEALALYARLGGRRQWQGSHARAALFLAASDLVRDRGDRARAWLDVGVSARGAHLPEVAYWQGRLAEVEGDPARAVQRYRAALVDDPFDPWAQQASLRLAIRRARGLGASEPPRSLAASGGERDLRASSLLAQSEADRAHTLERLRARLAARAPERAFMELAALPTARWPLWRSPATRAEARLLSVGDWELGSARGGRAVPFRRRRSWR